MNKSLPETIIYVPDALVADTDEAHHQLDLPQARVHPMYINVWRKHKANSEDKQKLTGDNNLCP